MTRLKQANSKTVAERTEKNTTITNRGEHKQSSCPYRCVCAQLCSAPDRGRTRSNYKTGLNKIQLV